jgi:hypothetical protein
LIGDWYFAHLRQSLAIDVRCSLAMLDLSRAKRQIILYFSARGFTFKGFPVCREIVATEGVAGPTSRLSHPPRQWDASRKAWSAGFAFAASGADGSGVDRTNVTNVIKRTYFTGALPVRRER